MSRSDWKLRSPCAVLLAISLLPVTATAQLTPTPKPGLPGGATSMTSRESSKPQPLLAYRRSGVERNSATSALVKAAPPQTLHRDSAITPASHVALPKNQHEAPHFGLKSSVEADPRRLAPATRSEAGSASSDFQTTSRKTPSFAIPQIESLTTAAAGLAIVVGLFLLCMWLLGRSGPKPTTPLPTEAFAVLGRVPLAARHFAHLLQVGNKLVLVSVTPNGVDPITEITDPAEVGRLLSLCMGNQKNSTTAEFQQVLQQLAREPAQGFLGREANASHAGKRRS